MKFWDTIAKMCGVMVENHWGRPPVTTIGVGGTHGSYSRDDVLRLSAANHRMTIVNTKDKVIDTFTIEVDGHGFRLIDVSHGMAEQHRSPYELFRIGHVAVERLRPMKAKSGSMPAAAESIERMAKTACANEPTILS